MQRYRINFHWLIGVFLCAFVLAVTSYFVWSWQVNRKAGYFLRLAEQATAEEKPVEAFDALRKYTQLRPDEMEARVKLGESAVVVVKNTEATREDRGKAYMILDQSVRLTNDSKLRKELAEIVLGFRPQDAIAHIEELLADDPGNVELNKMLATALFQSKDYKRFTELAYQLVGYDVQADTFKHVETKLDDDANIYALLAQVLYQRNQDEKLARRVIDEMVAANPESAKAHLSKSIFLRSLGEKEEAALLLDQAYALDSKDAAILLRKGDVALEDEKIDEAKGYFLQGRAEHPDSPVFIRMLAIAEARGENPENDKEIEEANINKALAILEDGIKKLDRNQTIDLVLTKLDLLVSNEDFSGIKAEIDRLEKLKVSMPSLQPMIDFQKTRILYAEKNWVAAAKEFKRVRPLLLDWKNYQVMSSLLMGICYERQGAFDLALDSYKTILSEYPEHEGALSGRERVMARRIGPAQDGAADLDMLVNKTLELPDREQDWAAVEKLVQQVSEENELSVSAQQLLRAKILIKRNMFEQAKELIRQAAKDSPEDVNVQYAAILLVASDPAQGPEPAMKLLDRLEKKLGRTLRSRAQRADLLVELRPDDVSEQLQLLVDKVDDLEEMEVSHLYKVLGLKFEQLNMLDLSTEYYEKSAVIEPNNLPILMHLFDLALRQRDDAAMRKAQEPILKLVGSERDPSYVLTEVKRQIMSFSRGEIGQEELQKMRAKLDAALQARGQWHELHITYGQLLLLLNEDINLALQHFDDALEYGPAKSNAVAIQVKLLADRKLYDQARDRMELLRPEIRTRVLGLLEAEVLMKTGDQELGLEKAKEIAKLQPNNAEVQQQVSRLTQESGNMTFATESQQAALRLNPADPDGWLRLIGLFAEQQRFDEAEDAIREAHLANDAEYLPLLSGKQYEMTSRWQMAEDLYLALYADRLDDLAVLRRLADFYLFWTKKEPLNVDKAGIYINRIMRAANEGIASADNPHVIWARQKAATILFAKNDYQQSLKAEKLLRQSMVSGNMTDEENQLLVDILINRNDPASLLQAKQLLLDFRDRGQLQKKGGMQLAQLLSRTKDWEAAEQLMLTLVAQNSDDLKVLALYVELLIDNSEFTTAERVLRQLRDLNLDGLSFIQLSAHLASERGDMNQLNDLLNSLVRKKDGALTDAQLQSMLAVAQLAAQYGAVELAEELYGIYADRRPNEALTLARFLALYGDCGRAIELMRRVYPDRPDDVVQLANSMLSARRAEVGDAYDEQVDRIINESLREEPDSLRRQLVRAEAYNTQGKYDQSIQAYEKLLKREDVPTRLRAAAMNNLGFLLALLNQRLDEAEQLINNAMQTFGPVEDMLDTRAVVRMAQGRYDLAIEDMQLALQISRDPVKYFHLAKAQILAGDGQSAAKAWEQARQLGFEKKSLSVLEQQSFEGIMEKIEAFQARNAQL